jgi:hypothetical protein
MSVWTKEREDDVVAEFCAETEKDYTDVFKAADEERVRRRRASPHYINSRRDGHD